MLTATLRALLAHPGIGLVQVVIHPEDRPLYDAATQTLAEPRLLPPISGGAERSISVANGLDALSHYEPKRVLIHDAARPFVSLALIDRVLGALDTALGAFPALPVADALWRGTDSVPRDGLSRAQTPQGFDFAAIRAAHAAYEGNAADDVAVARAAGLEVCEVAGEEANFKVTSAEDLARADAICAPRPDIRIGHGYDVHAFTDGDAVILCGVPIPHTRRLKGHSDADVAMHALTDALYGGIADGDIGQHFPPSDPQWKGAASDIFLRHAMGRVAARGYHVTHADITLICERPKIGPHALAMRESLSRITGLGVDRIAVKATTSERLGFTGREEGIAAHATVTLVRL